MSYLLQMKENCQAILTLCQIKVVGNNGLVTQARAYLDLASSISFISEQLAQLLRLPCRPHNMRISGIEGSIVHSSSSRPVQFGVTSLNLGGKTVLVEAVVLSKITSILLFTQWSSISSGNTCHVSHLRVWTSALLAIPICSWGPMCSVEWYVTPSNSGRWVHHSRSRCAFDGW